MIKQITIIGLGLIGGSIARALRKTKSAEIIVGYDQNKNFLKAALKSKIIHHYENSIAAAVRDADVIFIAVPPQHFAEVLKIIAQYRKPNSILTDVSSIKIPIINKAKKILKKNIVSFVPAHPIAGSEKQGWNASKEDLFKNCTVVITPFAKTSLQATKTIKTLWQKMGAKVETLTPAKHDKILANTSHMPQILAYLYFNFVSANKNLKKFTGSGFRDFTRLAASPADLWTNIVIDNNKELRQTMSSFIKKLQAFEKLLSQKNHSKILQMFKDANKKKKAG